MTSNQFNYQLQSRINYCTTNHTTGNLMSYVIMKNITHRLSCNEIRQHILRYDDSIKKIFNELLPHLNFVSYDITNINESDWLNVNLASDIALSEDDKRIVLTKVKEIFTKGTISHIPIRYKTNTINNMNKNPNQIYYLRFDNRIMQLLSFN